MKKVKVFIVLLVVAILVIVVGKVCFSEYGKLMFKEDKQALITMVTNNNISDNSNMEIVVDYGTSDEKKVSINAYYDEENKFVFKIKIEMIKNYIRETAKYYYEDGVLSYVSIAEREGGKKAMDEASVIDYYNSLFNMWYNRGELVSYIEENKSKLKPAFLGYSYTMEKSNKYKYTFGFDGKLKSITSSSESGKAKLTVKYNKTNDDNLSEYNIHERDYVSLPVLEDF